LAIFVDRQVGGGADQALVFQNPRQFPSLDCGPSAIPAPRHIPFLHPRQRFGDVGGDLGEFAERCKAEAPFCVGMLILCLRKRAFRPHSLSQKGDGEARVGLLSRDAGSVNGGQL